MSKIISIRTLHIDPELVQCWVYTLIDFAIPEFIWDEIESAFRNCWNNQIGFGGLINNSQIEICIQDQLMRQHILFDNEKLIKVVKLILEYIELTGGFLS